MRCQLKHTWCASVQSERLCVNNINCQSPGGINTHIIVRVDGMTFTLKTNRNVQHGPHLENCTSSFQICIPHPLLLGVSCTFDLSHFFFLF